jgi:hypothetical protein
MTKRWMSLLVIAGVVASCGDDSGGGDAPDACTTDCPGKPDAAMSPTDAGMDATMTPTVQPKMFTCPMAGGSGALECTTPALNVDFLKDAGVTMLGPLPIDLASSVVMPQGCCTEDDKCGVSVPMVTPTGVCFEQNQPGDQDGQCRDELLTLDATTMIPIPGCCKPNNECGLDLSPLGLGCGERGMLIGLISGSGGAVDANIPGSLPCNYGNPGGDDGGTDDGG